MRCLGEQRPLRQGVSRKIAAAIVALHAREPQLTMPKRFSTDVVSMVWRAGTSTRSNECSGLKGIVVVVWSPKARIAERSSGGRETDMYRGRNISENGE